MANEKTYIDIDLAINKYNEKNPDKVTWSRHQIAREYGISRNTVKNYERGESLGTIKFLKFLIKKTGLTYMDLIKQVK